MKPGQQVHRMVDPSAPVLGRMEDGIDEALLDRVLDGTRTGSGDGFLDVCEGVWNATASSLHEQIDLPVKPGQQVHGAVDIQVIPVLPRMENRAAPGLLEWVLDEVKTRSGDGFPDVCEDIWYAAAYSLHAQVDPGAWGPGGPWGRWGP